MMSKFWIRCCCIFGFHRMERKSALVCHMENCDLRSDIVLAWDQCEDCAKFKIVLLLR